MRIIAGLYKGRYLRCPSQNIRPVMSKMRESIFSILGSRFGSLEKLRFLDLFCGSAIMAVEAASRGACYVEAVEKDRGKRDILEGNLGILKIPWKLYILDVRFYLRNIVAQVLPFDIIYLDPPFRMSDKSSLLHALPAWLLKAETLVMMHLPKTEEAHLPERVGDLLELEAIKHYGGSSLCLYHVRNLAFLPK